MENKEKNPITKAVTGIIIIGLYSIIPNLEDHPLETLINLHEQGYLKSDLNKFFDIINIKIK